MPQVIHEIDPFGDTVIVLKSPCRNFAPWDETPTLSNTHLAEPEEGQSIGILTSEDERAGAELSKKEKKAKRASILRNSAGPSVSEVSGERAEPSIAALSGQQEVAHDWESASTVYGGVESSRVEPAEPAFESTKSEDAEIHYLVSSRHLMLASPWFRRTLTRDEFTEALKDPSDGRYHISASDWDEEALLILLNIFHVRTRQVPSYRKLRDACKDSRAC